MGFLQCIYILYISKFIFSELGVTPSYVTYIVGRPHCSYATVAKTGFYLFNYNYENLSNYFISFYIIN